MTIIGIRQYSDLAGTGPTVEVQIIPSKPILDARIKSGEKTLRPVSVSALIDTGASCSCIDKSIAETLNLTARDERKVLTASGESIQYLYDIRIVLRSVGVFDLQALGAELSRQAHKVLLGRDLLAHGTLIYSGWTKSFEFCV